ncbi:hypothetical protein NEOLEDRAFT_1184824 [Neolentinus lepideus HHB14362 ss-1]|uniref:Uncharacterized protein n=1 Tax=Neolentinus lepideus HHB14362 ss-1 TaxID=1314782 RepID=A0A165M572_9AGAM|nr:hypothetical protein NEOLEDRAFT_1184824 [Neolentinus lepideus HHB14362 ss-1]
MAYSPPSPRISASSIGATFLMRAVRIDTWHDHGYHDTAAPQNGPALYPSISSIARPRIIEEARSNAKILVAERMWIRSKAVPVVWM